MAVAPARKSTLKSHASRTGISRDQAALAATRNVTESGDPDSLLSLVETLIAAIVSGARVKTDEMFSRIVARMQSIRIASENSTVQPVFGLDCNHLDRIGSLISPSRNSYLIEAVETALLETDIMSIARALDKCRGSDPVFYQMLDSSDFTGAIALIRHENSDRRRYESRVSLVKWLLRCLLTKTAHDHVAAVRYVSLMPFGAGFAGFNEWHNVGHTCLATIAAPAKLLQRLAALEAAGAFEGLTDDALFKQLVKYKILPADKGGRAIFKLGQRGQKMELHHSANENFTSARLLAYVTDGSAIAADLNLGIMRQDALVRLVTAQNPTVSPVGSNLFTEDFVALRTGLSAAQAAGFVARELHRAISEIDLFIDDLLTGRELRQLPPPVGGKKKQTFISVLLRAEGGADVHAVLPTNEDMAPDADRNCGSLPFGQMLQRLNDPQVAAAATAELSINARAYFEPTRARLEKRSLCHPIGRDASTYSDCDETQSTLFGPRCRSDGCVGVEDAGAPAGAAGGTGTACPSQNRPGFPNISGATS